MSALIRGDLDAALRAALEPHHVYLLDHPGGVPYRDRSGQRGGLVHRAPEPNPRRALGFAQLALVAAIAWASWNITSSLPYWPVNPRLASRPWNQFLIDFVRCLWAILPAACLWGASFPLALAAVACRGSRRGIATTCLAETIGEDVKRLSKIFYEKHPESNIKLIPIQSPGYGGTQYGGYFTALRAVVENIEMDGQNEKINIVTGPISSADTRDLKDILNDFDIDYILLPDISENLDGVHSKKYNRLPCNGTSIEEIKYMGGAKATIELSTFIKEEYSVGSYLEEAFGVTNYRINIPRGLRDTDNFLKVLSQISGKPIPEKYKKQRGRYLDAMIDSHKYNAEARIAIFGEPDFVYSCARLAIENGVVPVLIATGDVCTRLEPSLREEIDELSKQLFAEECTIIDEADFKEIEKYVLDKE